jgi:alpha-tubulin suppressor-like RCC1 family protein
MRAALVFIFAIHSCTQTAINQPDAGNGQQAGTADVTEAPDAAPSNEASLRVTAIAVGGATSYALMSDGTVRGWGDGAHFALGRADRTAVGHPIEIAGVEHATAVFAGNLGEATACATIEDGRVFCWGDTDGFPLARDLAIEGVPATEIPALAGAREITIGTSFGCALMSDETVRCWGDVPEWVQRPPRQHREPELVPGLEGVVSVRAAWSHVCTLGLDGRVRCWGQNHGLQIAPTETRGFETAEPLVIEGVEDAAEIAVANEFNVARLGDGTLRAWGGKGDVEVSPGRVSTLAFDGTVVALSNSGLGEHVCAITDSGALRCVGSNLYGQLGIAPETDAATAMVDVPGLSDVLSVVASQMHSCALVRDGNVSCWGGNVRGELGDGTLNDQHEPRPVAHLLDIELPSPTPPKFVDDGPTESYEDLPEGCAHPTLTLALPDSDRTTFEVKSTRAWVTDDGLGASVQLRDHGSAFSRNKQFDYPRGDRLHLRLTFNSKNFVREHEDGPRVEHRVKVKPGVYRTFPAWLHLDSPRLQPTVDLNLNGSDGPILLEASPVRDGDSQEVTITRLGPDWICGTLAISSPRGTLTGDFAARIH